jgi:hypothetical protein
MGGWEVLMTFHGLHCRASNASFQPRPWSCKGRKQTPCGQTLTNGSGNQQIKSPPFFHPDRLYRGLQTRTWEAEKWEQAISHTWCKAVASWWCLSLCVSFLPSLCSFICTCSSWTYPLPCTETVRTEAFTWNVPRDTVLSWLHILSQKRILKQSCSMDDKNEAKVTKQTNKSKQTKNSVCK